MKKGYSLFVAVSLAMFLPVTAAAQMTPDEALSLFVHAGGAYKEGRYEEAITRYNAILDGGRENGAVYYNLGNSYFKNHNVGLAVLNYERALKFMPRDSDLLYNRHYVLTKINQHGGGPADKSILDWAVERFIGFYTFDEITMILLFLGLLTGCCYLIFQYRPGFRQIVRLVMGLLVLLLVLFAGGLYLKGQAERGMAVVLKAGESYFEPRPDSTLHFKLPEGEKVKILKSEGNWIKIRRDDGKSGWVQSDVCETI